MQRAWVRLAGTIPYDEPPSGPCACARVQVVPLWTCRCEPAEERGDGTASPSLPLGAAGVGRATGRQVGRVGIGAPYPAAEALLERDVELRHHGCDDVLMALTLARDAGVSTQSSITGVRARSRPDVPSTRPARCTTHDARHRVTSSMRAVIAARVGTAGVRHAPRISGAPVAGAARTTRRRRRRT